jgi:anti-anti-sigma factor
MNALLLEANARALGSLPQAPLEIAVEDRGSSVVVVQIRGEATCDQAARLGELLRSALRPRARFVILDLPGLTHVGPAALTTLADWSRQLRRTGGEVWLAGLQPALWLALHDAGLERLFTLRASVAQALTS